MHQHEHLLQAKAKRPAHKYNAVVWSLIDVLDFRHEPATHRKLVGQRVALIALLAASVFVSCMLRP